MNQLLRGKGNNLLLSQFEFEHGKIRHVSETTLAGRITTNQINHQSSILSQNLKSSYGNKASNIKLKIMQLHHHLTSKHKHH